MGEVGEVEDAGEEREEKSREERTTFSKLPTKVSGVDHVAELAVVVAAGGGGPGEEDAAAREREGARVKLAFLDPLTTIPEGVSEKEAGMERMASQSSDSGEAPDRVRVVVWDE